MKIIIIGSGWYGCHIATKLFDSNEICIIEKNSEIFKGSSYYNQNRLHLGFHYPRNFATRNSCKEYFDKFELAYKCLIRDISNNYYAISNNSLLDYMTYKNIYDHEGYCYKSINQIDVSLSNIEGNIFLVGEKFIDCNLANKYFNNILNNQNVSIHLNEEFISYTKSDNIIKVKTNKSTYECDLLLDCTYNQSGLSVNNYLYELTISLVYEKILQPNFDALTLMDGKLCSLYPRDMSNNLYTLTDVEFTPLIESNNFSDIKEIIISQNEIENIKNKMENRIEKYFKDFKKYFRYDSHFLSYKTKIVSDSDFRDTIIEEIEPNIITVNCGKIYGIFKFEEFVLNSINIYKIS